jgi:acyl-homoserine lactone acylase PvdQ
VLALGAWLTFCGVAPAQDDRVGQNDFGGFRNVLAVGQGETVNAAELAASEASNQPPPTFTNQLGMYTDLLYAAPGLQAADLDRYFKPAGFGVASADVASTVTPRPGVTIVRDRQFQVPHVYGTTREDTMFGAGYASAQDRMFLMDVLRHLGRARLTELAGPGTNDANVEADAEQLKIADYSEEELQRMIDVGAASAGEAGERMKADLTAYVAGINQYIDEARADQSKMPAEYAALGHSGPDDWKPTDTVAIASLIGGIFGRGGGSEALNGLVYQQARKRFGPRIGRSVFRDLRQKDDPEAPVTVRKRFPFDNPGRVNRRAVAVPDLGSFEERNPIVSGSTGSPQGGLQGVIDQIGLPLQGRMSNALLVSGRESESGDPVAVMGPQVGYYSPEILMELDLHGPGIDARGATFPGISLYILLGRGQDFAWSATTATTDVVDEFAEKLCEPDGARPTKQSTHYVYRGRCIPFTTRDHVVRTPVSPADPEPPREIVMRIERSVHGPIQARATVRGEPVAIAEARSTYFHELESALAFEQLNTNQVHDAASFQRAMGDLNFAFNWFYVDDKDIAYLQSGWYPRRARGVNPNLPAWGTGAYDWRGFDPEAYASRRLGFSRLPKAVNPKRGWLVNWNNKQAPGWRAADDNWSYSSVHRSERLSDRVRSGLRGSGKLSLTELVQIMETGATIDVRGQEVYPLLRRVIGRTSDPELSRMLEALDAWGRDGFHRRDLDRDNVLEHSAAVALMDAWWDPLMRRIFEPRLGTPLVEQARRVVGFGSPPPPGGSSFGDGWWGYVDKDLRRLLGRRVRGKLRHRYCGRGSRARCRLAITGALRDAARGAGERFGSANMGDWKIPATCGPSPAGEPRTCDQIEFTTGGAVSTAPIHWQDRPTFQQIVEVQGHRPR